MNKRICDFVRYLGLAGEVDIEDDKRYLIFSDEDRDFIECDHEVITIFGLTRSVITNNVRYEKKLYLTENSQIYLINTDLIHPRYFYFKLLTMKWNYLTRLNSEFSFVPLDKQLNDISNDLMTYELILLSTHEAIKRVKNRIKEAVRYRNDLFSGNQLRKIANYKTNPLPFIGFCSTSDYKMCPIIKFETSDFEGYYSDDPLLTLYIYYFAVVHSNIINKPMYEDTSFQAKRIAPSTEGILYNMSAFKDVEYDLKVIMKYVKIPVPSY